MTRPNGPDFVLSTHEFDLLWWALGFGHMPYPLEVPRIGRTPEQRAEFVNEVYRELGDRGLMTGAAVDDGLVSALHLLTCYHVAVDVVGDIGYPVRALAAAGPERGILAVLAGGELWLTKISSTALAAAITGVLPLCAPGTGPEKLLPCGAFGEAGDPLGEAIAAAGLDGGRWRSGLFGASTGDHRRSVSPVAWVDTEEGRYVMAHDGSRLHVVPGDKAALERQVATILAEVSVVPAQPGPSAAPGVWGLAPSGGPGAVPPENTEFPGSRRISPRSGHSTVMNTAETAAYWSS